MTFDAVSLHARFSMELALLRACLRVCRPLRVIILVRRTPLSRLRVVCIWSKVFCNALMSAEHAQAVHLGAPRNPMSRWEGRLVD